MQTHGIIPLILPVHILAGVLARRRPMVTPRFSWLMPALRAPRADVAEALPSP